jgi:hypothetical protein
MFLVEPRSGERCHYPTAQALSAAIRRGELGPNARIFHQTTNRWLSITVHPEYRQAQLDREERSARMWEDRPWTFLANRPDANLPDTNRPDPTGDELFGPIPGPMKAKASNLVLMPYGPAPSRLGSALRRFLYLARAAI